MNDSVSKAEVLEIYADLYDVFDDNKEICKELDKIYDRINELRSKFAKDTNVLSNDTISRQAAIDAINALHEHPNAWLDYAVDTVMELPSAQPEIIYCEDCKYRKDNFMGDWCTCWCGWTSLDGHCHKGANKDE